MCIVVSTYCLHCYVWNLYMGNNLKRKQMFDDCMHNCWKFGCPFSKVVNREPITPDLFMKIGTRVGTISMYYQMLSQLLVLSSHLRFWLLVSLLWLHHSKVWYSHLWYSLLNKMTGSLASTTERRVLCK